MPNTRARDILKRVKQASDVRDPWIPQWEDIARYFLPARDDILQTKPDGYRLGQDIFDGTAVSALQMYVDGIYGYMVSPAIQWFKLAVPDEQLNEDPEVRGWLEDTEARLYSSLRRSNFYEQVRPFLEDGIGFGTGVLYPEEDFANSKLMFSSITPAQCYLAENGYGVVDTLYRQFRQTTKQLVNKFGLGALSEHAKRLYAENPYTQIGVVHAVFPRSDRDTTKVDNQNMKWASVWIELPNQNNTGTSSIVADGHILHESGFEAFPYVAWRFRKSSNTPYGTSPCMEILADVMGLNEMGKTMLSAAQMSVEPPLNAPGSMEGEVLYEPRAINYYDDPQRIVTPMNTGINYPIGVDREERRQNAVERHLRSDFFMFLSTAEREMTATEVLERQSEKAAILGPAIGRLTSEALDKILDRVFALEMNAGRLFPPPDKLIAYHQATGTAVDIDYLGPLVQAQKRHFTTVGMERGLQATAGLMELRPELGDIINWDETMEELLEAHGFPQKAINPDEIVLAIREQRQQEIQQAQQVEQAEKMSKAVKQMAEADATAGGDIEGQLQGAV